MTAGGNALKLDAKQRSRILAAAKLLNESGVHLYIDGHFTLDAEQVVQYVEDPAQLYADLEGFPDKASYLIYEKWLLSGGQCSAITRKGEQCKNFNCYHPSKFIPGVSDRCWLHVDRSA